MNEIELRIAAYDRAASIAKGGLDEVLDAAGRIYAFFTGPVSAAPAEEAPPESHLHTGDFSRPDVRTHENFEGWRERFGVLS